MHLNSRKRMEAAAALALERDPGLREVSGAMAFVMALLALVASVVMLAAGCGAGNEPNEPSAGSASAASDIVPQGGISSPQAAEPSTEAFALRCPGADADGDGFYTEPCPGRDALDCNDADASIHPAAAEVCDNLDNNCDGVPDGVSVNGMAMFLFDQDGDGHKSSAQCGLLGDDCDDRDDAVYAGVVEVCDSLDNDCNGIVDTDAVGYAAPCDNGQVGECRRTGFMVCPALGGLLVCDAVTNVQATDETCDGLDNDCDGAVDEDPAILCPDDGQACNGEEHCDGLTHVGISICSRRNVPIVGTSCDDGNLCTLGDACDGASACVPGSPPAYCGAGTTCVVQAGQAVCVAGPGNPCDACGAGTSCLAGVCVANLPPLLCGAPDANGRMSCVFTNGAQTLTVTCTDLDSDGALFCADLDGGRVGDPDDNDAGVKPCATDADCGAGYSCATSDNYCVLLPFCFHVLDSACGQNELVWPLPFRDYGPLTTGCGQSNHSGVHEVACPVGVVHTNVCFGPQPAGAVPIGHAVMAMTAAGAPNPECGFTNSLDGWTPPPGWEP